MIYHPPVMKMKTRYAVPLFCVLVCAGLAGNAFPVSILNAHFIFGSLFAMLALQVFGWVPGIGAAAVISAYTWLNWNHPWAMVTMTAEAAAVGWLFTRRRFSMVAADALYWVCVGIPLGLFCFHFFSGVSTGDALFLLTKQAINGIANTLAARLLTTGWIVIRPATGRIAFREVLSNLLLVFALGPVLLFLALAGRADMAETDRRIRDALVRDSRQLSDGLEAWLSEREQVVTTMAQMAQTLDAEEMQARLDQAWQSDTGFLAFAILITALVLAELLGRRLVRPIDRIVQTTRTLPARVAAGESVEWLKSPVLEADILISNLKIMADSLKSRFRENQEITESLERRIAERTDKIRESEAFLESIIANIPAVVFVKDAATLCFVKVNRACENLLGYSVKELIGKNDYDFFPKEEADFFTQKDRQALSGGRLVEIAEETVLTRHFGERILHTKKIPVLDRRGIPLYLLGISEDITESKKDRKALEEANLRLRQSQAAVLNILDDLKAENVARMRNVAERDKLQAQLIQAQKMESVGRLAGGVAHDFNNMLNVILGYTELALQNMDKDDPLYEDLTEILSAARRSSDITRQLLAFARKQTIAPVTLDLNETVEGMLKMLRRLIGEDIDLSWEPGPGLWLVNMDPAQVDQVLANLLVNARDAISGVGKVTIETENVALDEHYCADRPDFVPGEYVLLAVSDDGCGMDKQTRDHLFEPFFTTKGVGEGTGLGLATVYGIVRQNSGFINIYSEPGQGATFKIYLPRHAGEAAAEPLFTGMETPHGAGENILVVEDEPSVLKLADRMLTGMGYTVLAAPGPAAALELAQRHTGPIDLLITDVVMPEMSGRDLAEKLESMHPGLRVLYMSGYTANVIAHRGILDKGVQFIQKPFNKRSLAKKVREAMGDL